MLNTLGAVRSTRGEGASGSNGFESPATPMYETLTLGGDESIWSQEGFRAKGHHMRGDGRDSITPKPLCGKRCGGPLASFDPDTSSSRTWRRFSLSMTEPYGELFLGTWPRSGSMCDGTVYPLRPSVPRTSAIGSLPLLPTPKAKQSLPNEAESRRNSPDLVTTLVLLPTPNATMQNYDENVGQFLDRRERLKERHINGNGIGLPLGIAIRALSSGANTKPPSDDGNTYTDSRLNPSFVEWMIGAPQGWTDTDCPLSVTEFKFRSEGS